MPFSVNAPIIYVIVALIIALVLGQSIFFLVRALRRAKQLGIAQSTVKKTISSSAVFTVAPAVAILIGIVALSKSIGVALPWLRLSVIGSITYETIAAANALEAAGMTAGTTITDPSIFVTVAWVMTVGIAAGLVFVPFVTKKIQSGLANVTLKDKKWGEIFNNAMFLGMISAFLGYVFCDVDRLWKAVDGVVTVVKDGETLTYSATSGLIPICVMATSALVMAICGTLATKLKIRWLTDYALPLSLIAGMASAIPYTMWLGGV